MIRVIVSTREEEALVIAALGAAGLRDLDDYVITGAPPDPPRFDPDTEWLRSTGRWTPPPPITDCPVAGFAAVDDPAYDMCVCGRRHITVTASGSGGSEEGAGQ